MPDMAISTVLHTAQAQLRRYDVAQRTCEAAFFGGTFTALPQEDFEHCLYRLKQWRAQGLVESARCSTRPDAVLGARNVRLADLREAGCSIVELGVQSYDNTALLCSQRGYDGELAREGCAAVLAAGLTLGVQLLPGMPGVSPEIFLHDVRMALDAGAAFLRFYPCLVLEGTALAMWWRQGSFIPWTLEESVDALAQGWLLARERNVPVIRMGLAPEEGLEKHVLAGPSHPALGALVQAEALYREVAALIARSARPPSGLTVPRFCQGFFWGHCGALRPRWRALGIDPSCVDWHDLPEVHVW